MKKAVIFFSILFMSIIVGHRIQALRKESAMTVNNIARLHKEIGVPKRYVIAEYSTDFLFEPLHVRNGRALVSTSRIGKFRTGQKVRDMAATITSVSNGIDLDTGMFVVLFSQRISGNVFIEQQYSGFFLPLDTVLPPRAKVIARDLTRMVATGLEPGERLQIK